MQVGKLLHITDTYLHITIRCNLIWTQKMLRPHIFFRPKCVWPISLSTLLKGNYL